MQEIHELVEGHVLTGVALQAPDLDPVQIEWTVEQEQYKLLVTAGHHSFTQRLPGWLTDVNERPANENEEAQILRIVAAPILSRILILNHKKPHATVANDLRGVPDASPRRQGRGRR